MLVVDRSKAQSLMVDLVVVDQTVGLADLAVNLVVDPVVDQELDPEMALLKALYRVELVLKVEMEEENHPIKCECMCLRLGKCE